MILFSFSHFTTDVFILVKKSNDWILKEEGLESAHIGIGHTRWATHGAPSDVNSHPHVSANKEIAVVHNGIIENYIELKQMLTEKGYKFITETDTEVVAHLYEDLYDGDMISTTRNLLFGLL